MMFQSIGRGARANQGIEAGGATPGEFTRYVRTEIENMGTIIKASGARPE